MYNNVEMCTFFDVSSKPIAFKCMAKKSKMVAMREFEVDMK